ncbi:9122_t:CDS:2, partial [Funneliformis geosporum]
PQSLEVANIGPRFYQSFRQPNSSMFMIVDSDNQMRQQHRAGERILTPEWWYSTDLSMRDNRMRRRHRA